jgi:hypothetical protein
MKSLEICKANPKKVAKKLKNGSGVEIIPPFTKALLHRTFFEYQLEKIAS